MQSLTPIFGVLAYNEKIVTLAEIGELMRNRINGALVLLFNFMDFRRDFGNVIYPKTDVIYKAVHLILLFKAFYERRINAKLFQIFKRFNLSFLRRSVHLRTSIACRGHHTGEALLSTRISIVLYFIGLHLHAPPLSSVVRGYLQ